MDRFLKEGERTATFVRDVSKDWSGTAYLYKLSVPLKDEPWGGDDDEECPEFTYVVASATVVMFSGAETYIFGADEDGHVESFAELPGSMRGIYSPEKAMQNAGYTVIDERRHRG